MQGSNPLRMSTWNLVCNLEPQPWFIVFGQNWNVIILGWLGRFSITPCQQIMIGNITQPFFFVDLRTYSKREMSKYFPCWREIAFLALLISLSRKMLNKAWHPDVGKSTNPKGNLVKSNWENSGPISRLYNGIAPSPSPSPNIAFNHTHSCFLVFFSKIKL